MKKTIVLLYLASIFATIVYLFWHYQFVYSLPTPVPKFYKVVAPGSNMVSPLNLHLQTGKPTFLHFFNPDCPCSKFNIAHFKSLVNQYDKQVSFAIVVMSNKTYAAGDIQHRFGISLPVYFDTSLAISCGVYSTPQAVIIDPDQKLYYRGNYNRSRYCTDGKTNYAQQALEALLHKDQALIFDGFALRAYGCRLPNCLK